MILYNFFSEPVFFQTSTHKTKKRKKGRYGGYLKGVCVSCKKYIRENDCEGTIPLGNL